jgi:hypothetical protein
MATTKTQRIAGHSLTLTAGLRYRASRPFAGRGRTEYPVTVSELTAQGGEVKAARIPGLTYEQANRLVNSFNNGRMSFDGREWK